MNLVKFPVAATNIFPIANSTAGGQLLTEYNLRSRETVGTDINVPSSLHIGPSYVHSMRDFALSGNGSVVTIHEGKGLFNGHYVELLTPIDIDLTTEITKIVDSSERAELRGDLTVGILVMYSTLNTMASTILTEKLPSESDDPNDAEISAYYQGVHIVILPTAKAKTPSDVWVDGAVPPGSDTNFNMHLKLGRIIYKNGAIQGDPIQDENKIKQIDGSRISNIDAIISDSYLTNTHTRNDTFYAYNPYAGLDETRYGDGWVNINPAMIKWRMVDAPTSDTAPNPNATAEFVPDGGGRAVNLVLPHLQIPDYKVSGQPKYFEDIVVPIAEASPITGIPGVLGKSYMEHISSLARKLDTMYAGITSLGTMKLFINILDDRTVIDDLVPASEKWNVGDYVLVSQDNTVESVEGRPCSTMYVVEPGILTKAKPAEPFNQIPEGGVPVGTLDDVEVQNIQQDPEDGKVTWESLQIRARRGDYFVIVYSEDSATEEHPAGSIYGYYVVERTGKPSLNAIDPIYITGGVPLAYEDTVGGFLNVPNSSLGQGYVYRDEDGHLRLLDFDLLVSGVLAYRLSEDYVNYSYDANTIAAELEEFVNNRVAFKDETAQTYNYLTPPSVNITLQLTDETVVSDSELKIHSIDSRFGTYVNLTIDATTSSMGPITVYVSDIEKLRLHISDAFINSGSNVVITRCCMYYDPDTLNKLDSEDTNQLTYWYCQFDESDPDLVVNDTTIQRRVAVTPMTSEPETNWWSQVEAGGQMQTYYGIDSITLSHSGEVIGMGFAILDHITQGNDLESRSMNITDLTISSGIGFPIPYKKFNYNILASGNYSGGYWMSSASGNEYKMHDVSINLNVYPYESAGGTATTNIHAVTTEVINCYTLSTGQVNPQASDDTSTVSGDIAGLTSGLKFIQGRALSTEG